MSERELKINFEIGGYSNSKLGKGVGYPDRGLVPVGLRWNEDGGGYKPVEYTAQRILAGGEWIDPIDSGLSINSPDFAGYEGKALIDSLGRPLNPKGPTGITGRGLLGRWGPNFAADSLVTRIGKEGDLEILLIKRQTGEWAIPGGFVDKGENVAVTLSRELEEEVGQEIDFSTAEMVYRGYVYDPRNTDNAWIETTAGHVHLGRKSFVPRAGDDAKAVVWRNVKDTLSGGLYASHAGVISLMLRRLQ